MALPVIVRPDVPPDHATEFHNHVCPPTHGGGPFDVLPGEVPDVQLTRKLSVDLDLPLPPRVATRVGSPTLPMWVIDDPDDDVNGRQFPSKLIRVRRDQLVYARVEASRNTHTIHWHGIEPSPANDGVGKHSFEISGNFIYRFQPHSAGTFFYHCHKNTPLHFEMGLYGALIVDPPEGPGFYQTRDATLPGFDRRSRTIPYQVEAVWAVDEFDSNWHFHLDSAHDAFMQACDEDDPMNPDNFTRDGFLHDFRPDIFAISGAVAEPTAADPTRSEILADPRAAVTGRVGETILLRVLCAGYFIQEFSFGLPARVVGMDGVPLGVPPAGAYSHPFTLPVGRSFQLTSARRWDLVFVPSEAGVFPAAVTFLHPVTRQRLFTINTAITVAP
jgi:FtsP/CotA-like multicopper oxidase with cupredoxin domain